MAETVFVFNRPKDEIMLLNTCKVMLRKEELCRIHELCLYGHVRLHRKDLGMVMTFDIAGILAPRVTEVSNPSK